jgi:hypothetical protein
MELVWWYFLARKMMTQGNDTQNSVGNAVFPYLLQLCDGERWR